MEKVKELFESGKSGREIGEAVGVSHVTVAKYLKDLGLRP